MLAEVGVTVPHAGPGAEVAGHSFGGPPAVGDAVLISFQKIMNDGPLVVRFCKIRIDSDGFVATRFGGGEIPAAHRLSGLGELAVGLAILSRPEPERPERVLGHFVDHRIRVAQLPGQLPRASWLADQGESEQGYFPGVGLVRFDQLNDLARFPPGLEQSQKPMHILGFQQRLDEFDELSGIDLRQSNTAKC